MRWIALFFLLAFFLLFALIYVDKTSNPLNLSKSNHHTIEQKNEYFADKIDDIPSFSFSPNSFQAFHTGVDLSDVDAMQQRISEIELRLIEIGHTREAIPFYGELTLLFMQIGREDGAAEAARHTAMILDDADDWWNSAVLFYRWALKQTEQEAFFHYLSRSEDSFKHASKNANNPEMLTDYSIVLQANGKTAKALEQLERAILLENASFRPFLYYGLILNETDKKDESILYIYKSMEKAIDEEELSLIRRVLSQSSIEI